MIHIITIHFKSERWIDLQLKHINKHIKNYKMWVYCDGFDHLPHKDKFNFCQEYTSEIRQPCELDHIEKLNSLTNVVLNDKKTNNTDLLVWLDSDAFPIRGVNDYINEKLLKYPLIAIQRPENGGDVIPHPSFTCCSVDFWKKTKLNWDGQTHQDRVIKNGLHDPGGKIYKVLLEKNIEWYKLLRTKSLTKHQVFFTIYDDMIYHHGAGSRVNKDGFAVCRGGTFGASYDESEIFNNLNDFNANYDIT